MAILYVLIGLSFAEMIIPIIYLLVKDIRERRSRGKSK